MGTVIRKSVWIAAAPEAVWDAYCLPVRASAWLEYPLTLDLAEGGRYALDMGTLDLVEGTVLEVERPRFLHHTSGDVDGTRGSHIRLTLEEEAGGTRLTLEHSGIMEEGADRIWDHHLARLAVAAAGDDPGADPLNTEWPTLGLGFDYFNSWKDALRDED